MNLKIRKVTGTISVAKKKFRRKPFFAISPFLCFGPKWKFCFGRTFEFFHRKLLLTVFTSCCWCCIYSEEIFAGIMSPGKVELLQPWPLGNNSPSRLMSFDRTNTDKQAWKINEPHHDAIESRLCCFLPDPSLLSSQTETKKGRISSLSRKFEIGNEISTPASISSSENCVHDWDIGFPISSLWRIFWRWRKFQFLILTL